MSTSARRSARSSTPSAQTTAPVLAAKPISASSSAWRLPSACAPWTSVRSSLRMSGEAGERLVAAGAARRGPDDRLEDAADAVRADLQQRGDLRPLHGLGPDRAAAEAARAAAAGVLGQIQRRVAVLQQHGSVGAVL